MPAITTATGAWIQLLLSTAAQRFQVKEKLLQWEVRSQTLKSTFGSVATGWERTGLPAKFSMSDPLVNQPLPRKRILAEGL